ncbi:MAG: hypothetical protein A2918_00710 [Candidatus Yanofskybacteria bacterium RIFCSPLOWO2_01_FULL_42_49]|uniref:Uncharacterized protein n=1 Tax=Candidatus Yanofskybacteria bacterium RIFCSPLOWO2_01_FULL_42_49 TaxID=1802694 RepID=A0A1F8GGK7_9BACT|nr:MAG: hypothetical protein A2918_00710 [Candidatus Yanofskybacteria bacterium RIFCSPLOWO2_01_FULL_42_49]
MNKKVLYVVIIIIVAVALTFWWWSTRQASREVPSDASDINQSLEELNISSLDGEFDQVDQDLNNL